MVSNQGGIDWVCFMRLSIITRTTERFTLDDVILRGKALAGWQDVSDPRLTGEVSFSIENLPAGNRVRFRIGVCREPNPDARL